MWNNILVHKRGLEKRDKRKYKRKAKKKCEN